MACDAQFMVVPDGLEPSAFSFAGRRADPITPRNQEQYLMSRIAALRPLVLSLFGPAGTPTGLSLARLLRVNLPIAREPPALTVDQSGFEPLTFSMPLRRAPGCATSPYSPGDKYLELSCARYRHHHDNSPWHPKTYLPLASHQLVGPPPSWNLICQSLVRKFVLVA